MAKVFLDANILVDILENRKDISIANFNEDEVYASALSVHILFYVTKKKVPYPLISRMLLDINLVNLNRNLTNKALGGPTNDFEDNIQLHSAADADCNYFLTNDSKLLKMKFFGKVQLASSLKKEK